SGHQTIKIGDITPTRDLVFVDDTTQGFIEIAACEKLIGHEVNIATCSEISIGDLAKQLIQLINPQAVLEHEEQRYRPSASEVFRLFGSNTKLKEFTGWQPSISLEAGLKQTIDWFASPENLASYKADIYNL
ncbi:MAG TPA: GDP-mannose 4,6-dehydratase, partial [Luteibaculaceae bacterium]|nr:GDP-mannose 4,6-dehydratase [Luteibaculaceae bacterium]